VAYIVQECKLAIHGLWLGMDTAPPLGQFLAQSCPQLVLDRITIVASSLHEVVDIVQEPVDEAFLA
jgi:hypothetical protein